MKSEDIPPELWSHVASALKRFFTGKIREPEEPTQETLTRVAIRLTTGELELHGENAFEKYCFGVARNVLKEQWTGQHRCPLPMPIDVARPENRTQGMNSFETTAHVRHALGCLSTADRDLLANADRMDLDALAARYERPKKTMAVQHFRVKARLREILSSSQGNRKDS